MDDEDRDDPPRIEYVRRDELTSEKMVNGQAKRRLDEADKPSLEDKHIPAIVSPADHVAIIGKLRDAELKLRDAELKLRDAELKLKGAEFKLEKIKEENDVLVLTDENFLPQEPKTLCPKSRKLKKKSICE